MRCSVQSTSALVQPHVARHSYVPRRGHIIPAPCEYVDGADHIDREIGFDFAFDAFAERVHAVDVLTAEWRQKWDRRQAG
jgi:hypothetical protein